MICASETDAIAHMGRSNAGLPIEELPIALPADTDVGRMLTARTVSCLLRSINQSGLIHQRGVPASKGSKEIVMRKLYALITLAGMLLIAGCNTISGAGKDIERGGEKVQGAAESTKQKM
ncbi:putative small secreted protein [Cupriavidus metallidurans]|jgi:predicted small secreted protein